MSYGGPSAPPGGYQGGYQPPAGQGPRPGGYGQAPAGYNQAPGSYNQQTPGGYNQARPGGYNQSYGGPGQQGYQQGFQQHAPPPPQQGADLGAIFSQVDKDRSGNISANELQQALSNGTWKPFNAETIRLMISMFDKDGNGTINFQEFGALWKYINDWQNTFRYYDRDNSGSIDQNELQTAIASFGYRLSAKFYGLLMQKFDRNGDRTITFDDFIQCCVLIQTLSAAFQRKDANRNGWIQINYEEFMELVFSTRI